MIQFSTIVYITSKFNFAKEWIQKLNSYLADFEQVKKIFDKSKKILVISINAFELIIYVQENFHKNECI